MWGRTDPAEIVRQRLRHGVDRLRRAHHGHHGEYDPSVSAQLPYGEGLSPSALVELVEGSGWARPASSGSVTSSGPACSPAHRSSGSSA
ncbi:MAG TPA: hypothetical protein VEP73_09655 [Actinomycetota bacterium]|nr:hypothetical protein [Actinomycetota bacterium]